jgi:catechol 2,3-dioxygenase-like lactoylglutathione lyase family enzyme
MTEFVVSEWEGVDVVGLADCRVGAAIAVSDMTRAREFYETALGLVPATDHEPENNVMYVCGAGTIVHVFATPHAGTATSTVAGWEVDDIERTVDELTGRGVAFEQYDGDGIHTDARGIATFPGDNRVAYFKDPDGNVLSLAQPGPG